LSGLVERAYFSVCLGLGRLLRSAKYSKVRLRLAASARQVLIVPENDCIEKRRAFYAPLLVWMGAPLMRLLDTGVRVLPQRDWERREREIYRIVYGVSIRVGADGTLFLPYLAGKTLASVLDDPSADEPTRETAIERAVVALAEFHRLGFTHGDAMADNVMVDLEAGVARWFDFETVHESTRLETWRRADDVRALLSTCLARTPVEKRDVTRQRMLDIYANDEVARVLAASFTSTLRRSLAFHLGQAHQYRNEY
jgi:hypothetical protein